jgi:hypothetical protein
MTDIALEERLTTIAKQCRAQAEGPYTPRSDAVSALYAIETIALLLIEERNARRGGEAEHA